MKILWYRLLDSLQSFWRSNLKAYRAARRWGKQWRDCVRAGRKYSRVVERCVPVDAGMLFHYEIRTEPGWEMYCFNCHEYSIVTESMMPKIIAEWAADVKRMTERAAIKEKKFVAPPKPTAATAGCTCCNALPGDPE